MKKRVRNRKGWVRARFLNFRKNVRKKDAVLRLRGAGKEVYFLTEDLAASGKKRAVREWKKSQKELKTYDRSSKLRRGIVIYRGKY